MKSRKLIVMALVIALTMSLAVPAILAATDSSTTITGTYEEPDIDVVVMPTGTATINPYEMPVKAMDTNAAGAAQVGTALLENAGQIACQPLVMYNKTTVPLSVGATVSAENVSTGLELVTRALSPRSTDKQALVYLEAKQSANLGATDYFVAPDTDPDAAPGVGYIGNVNGARLVSEFNTWEQKDYLLSNEDQVIVNPEEPTTKKGIATMAAGDGTGPLQGSYVMYRLSGQCVEEPDVAWKAAADDGSGADGFTVKVAFSFSTVKPAANPTPTP